MSAEKQQPTHAEASVDACSSPLPSQPTSSPIEAYGTPSLGISLPPVDRRRSQSSSFPRLQLASTGAMEEAAGKTLPSHPVEVDELDEFDSQVPVELDSEVCERLEAESLRTAHERRQQSASLMGNNSKGKKRAKQSSTDNNREVIDLREDSPRDLSEPARPSKKSKEQNHDGRNCGPLFQEGWVRDLLARRDVRAPSPPEPEHIGDRHTHLPIASQPRTNGAVSQLEQSQQVPKECGADASLTSSCSDDDVPLSSLITSLSGNGANKPTPVLAAIAKVEKAVAELEQAYLREMACAKGKLAERELLIDQLRAKLRSRPSRKIVASKDTAIGQG